MNIIMIELVVLALDTNHAQSFIREITFPILKVPVIADL